MCLAGERKKEGYTYKSGNSFSANTYKSSLHAPEKPYIKTQTLPRLHREREKRQVHKYNTS